MSKKKPLPDDLGAELFGDQPEKDNIFRTTKKQKFTSKQVYKRATFHLYPDQIKQIKVIAFHKDKDISEVVREALNDYISKHVNK